MGAYVNPSDQTKEEWLEANGIVVSEPPVSLEEGVQIPEGFLPVCLVNNGMFTAAGICYDERELKEFSDPTDWREKTWYLVSIRELNKVSPLQDYTSRLA